MNSEDEQGEHQWKSISKNFEDINKDSATKVK